MKSSKTLSKALKHLEKYNEIHEDETIKKAIEYIKKKKVENEEFEHFNAEICWQASLNGGHFFD